jgi:histidinol-phosphate aminotransferase
MTSPRTPVELARPEIRALAPYASARALADSAGILLNANENPWPPAGDGGLALNRYPDPQPAALRARMADFYGIAPDQLLITRGSDEGIDLLVRAFCRAGEDRVLICPPCFGMYAMSARIQGAEVIEVPLIEGPDDWVLDFDGILAAAPARLYFLCSPNNPTGNLIEAGQVLSLAQRVADHGLVVIDEAYIEFCDRPSLSACLAEQPNLVILRTLSKAFALAGCRIGALIADTEIVGLLRRIIAPYPLPTPSVHAALAALDGIDALARQLDDLAAQKTRLVAALEAHPEIARLWPGAANFVLVRVADGAGLIRAAAAAGIRLRDQSAQPGLGNCVRITIGTAEETDTLIQFLNEWRA